MITTDNFKQIESELNSRLRDESDFEDWMYFSVSPMSGATGKFVVGYLLPTSHGVSTDMSLREALDLYSRVTQSVLSS